MSRIRRTRRQRRKKRTPRSTRTAGLEYLGREKRSELGEPQLAFVNPDTGKITLERDYRLRPPPGQWRSHSPNPEIRIGAPPFEAIDDTRCRVCGERVDQWRANVTWEDGTRLIRENARNQGVTGGGYRTRGPVLYAMHTIKLRRWWDRHIEGGCMALWEEWKGQVPYPRPVVWGCFYGRPRDCRVFSTLEALHSLGIYRPSDWPTAIRQEAIALAVSLHREPDLDRIERQRPPVEPDYPDWTEEEIANAVAQLLTPDTSQIAHEAAIPF